MKNADKDCVVFSGSQSGVAEDLASRVAKEGHFRFGLKTVVGSLEDCDYENPHEFSPDCVAIFMMATFGEEKPTDNAQDVYNFITTEGVAFSQGGTTSDNPLCNMSYVIFDLGNSTYEHFSAVPTRLTVFWKNLVRSGFPRLVRKMMERERLRRTFWLGESLCGLRRRRL